MTVHVLPVWEKNPYDCPEVSTVSSGASVRELSPFVLTVPCSLINAEGKLFGSIIFENLWQFSKVYKEHTVEGEPSKDYFSWRIKGWADTWAHRYPMGKGRKPEYSLWDNEKLGYIEARKKIYATVYAENVVKTVAYSLLEELYKEHGEVTLKDYDAYDHIKLGMSLVDVINNPDRKMGHAFVLAMLLENKLEECLNS